MQLPSSFPHPSCFDHGYTRVLAAFWTCTHSVVNTYLLGPSAEGWAIDQRMKEVFCHSHLPWLQKRIEPNISSLTGSPLLSFRHSILTNGKCSFSNGSRVVRFPPQRGSTELQDSLSHLQQAAGWETQPQRRAWSTEQHHVTDPPALPLLIHQPLPSSTPIPIYI